MEAKTIKQILSNLPDEVKDMAMVSAILAIGRERLDEVLYTCKPCESPEVSALMGTLDLGKAIGGIDYWTNIILNLKKDCRKIFYVNKNQISYLLFLHEIASSNLNGTVLDPITLYTSKRTETIQVVLEENVLNVLINMGLKVNYNVVIDESELHYN